MLVRWVKTTGLRSKLLPAKWRSRLAIERMVPEGNHQLRTAMVPSSGPEHQSPGVRHYTYRHAWGEPPRDLRPHGRPAWTPVNMRGPEGPRRYRPTRNGAVDTATANSG